jgi:N-acetylmuramoyl-L-alanine amidase
MVTRTVVLDPGHGGSEPAGGSSANQATGARGMLEKDLTLDIARRVRGLLPALDRVSLTRDADLNVTLGDRARASRAEGADVFVSIHFNASEDPAEQGSEVWVHDRAGPRSTALAERILAALVGATGYDDRGVRRGPMAVLDPGYHPTKTAACLAEISFLSDPREEDRLQRSDYRQRLAAALAGAIREQAEPLTLHARVQGERFDIWHEVPLVQQLTGMSCWAAAAAMIVGWRDCIGIEPGEVAKGTGRWEAYSDGLEPTDVDTLARAFGLFIERPRAYTVNGLRRLLERNGPLWVGEASPGLHVIVIAGMYGDGTRNGTFVRVADPWPVGKGERYTIAFGELARNLEAAADVVGIQAQVLHAGGRGGAARREFHAYEASYFERMRGRLSGAA